MSSVTSLRRMGMAHFLEGKRRRNTRNALFSAQSPPPQFQFWGIIFEIVCQSGGTPIYLGGKKWQTAEGDEVMDGR